MLPSPLAVIKTLLHLGTTAGFWLSLLGSMLRVLCGFTLAMLAGALLGVLTSASRAADAFLTPLRSVVRATPITSFIILVLLYLSSDIAPMFISFLTVLPIAWTNVCTGIQSTDRDLLEMAHAYGFSRAKIVKSIYAPSVLPHFLSAATTGLGFAWKSGVAAEVIAVTKNSIGLALYESKLYLEAAELFAWTASVVIMSMLLEKLMVHLFGRIQRWKP